ncbi:MAG TPA: radical SAM protein [Candidatus Omnitrophota bacterium]|nr:radical SAM protein [Candidatus Omnitrophota bacterium]HPT07471.1 radical SAM protein [Candidatus Omnitrophota bacterium]
MSVTPKNNLKKYLKLKELNALLVAEDIKQSRHVALGLPLYIGLFTAEECNLRCIMCIHRKNERERGLVKASPLDEKTLVRFAQEVFPTAQYLALNTGGEPMLSPTIDLELQLAEEYGVKLDIMTNGMFLDDRHGRLNRIVHNAKSVSFSLDSPCKKTFESIRIGADFDKVIRNMRLYHALRLAIPVNQRPNFFISMVVMRRNIHEVPQMVELAHSLGADAISFPALDVHIDELREESIDPVSDDDFRFFATAKALARGYNNMTLAPAPKFDQERLSCQPAVRLNTTCGFLWKRAYIDNLGKIVICCASSHPVAGDFTQGDFQTIWNNEEYQARRKVFVSGAHHPECSVCCDSGYLSSLVCTI